MAHYPDQYPLGWQAKTFRVNLETQMRQSFPVPNSTSTIWSGVTQQSEADNKASTRWAYFPDNMRNNRRLNHGDTFDVSGEVAYYLKKTYCSNPPARDDLLVVVTES